jgi:nucleoside-diphosphate-sugar epimerase
MKMQKSLLIVGCGYLGMRVLKMASQSGWNVYGTSRKIEKKSEIESSGARFIHFDITRPETIANLPPASHWLWSPAFDRSQGLSVHEVVAGGLMQSLNLAEHQPSHLVFISTTGVFHQLDGESVDELSPTHPQTDSGRAHLEAEHRLAAWSNQMRANVTTLRLSGLYGPGRWIRRKSIENGEPIACNPESWLNLLHIDDAASACMAVHNCELPRDESRYSLFCVTDDQPITRGEFYQTSARLLKAPEPRFETPTSADFSGNKKVINIRFKTQLNWQPFYPNIESGLMACI